MDDSQHKLIEIERIIQEKAGSKAKFIPKMLIEWLRRLIHEDDVNAFMAQSSGAEGVEWLKQCVEYLEMKVNVKGQENLPADDGKKYTFVSNHPLGGADGVILGSIIGEHYHGNIRYLLNDLLTNLPPLKKLGIPINKTGAQSRNLPQMVEAGFQSEHQLLLFPAGLCSRKKNGVIADLPWKKTFIAKSIETQRDIVPIHFSGHNSNRFYRIANLCALLHSKINFAMLFLVDEMYKNKGKDVEVSIGKPIPWQTFDKSHTTNEWAQYVRDIVYKL
ncbi:MAG TPA: glycerol acyltransferase [Prevotellaceae bacterium]|jgi:putative hemolysin|nr:glycerol acyltransferase [Prevotellaceae bacterium]